MIVRRALEGLDGVKKAEVSLAKENAVVYFEKGKATVDQMIRTIEGVGFGAREIEQ